MILSGQKAVAAAGTAVALGDQVINGPLLVKAFNGNGGMIYIGNDSAGDVTSANGLELDASEEVYFNFVGNLSEIILDTSNNGDKVAWLALNV